MPSIKVNSIAKKLGVGFKTIVEYLNEKDDSKRYNVNSKLTTDQLRALPSPCNSSSPPWRAVCWAAAAGRFHS